MAAFELGNNELQDSGGCGESGKRKNDSIIALKIYDSCRQQDCLTADILGPPRAAEDVEIGGVEFLEGDVLIPPERAATVSIEDLKVKTVTIVNKKPCAFRKGYWDINLKYVFEYYLTFYESDGTPISPSRIKTNSFFNRKSTLFGSDSSDITISTDLFNNESIQSGPYVEVEAKAVALSAEINFCGCNRNDDDASRIDVTIGLFSIIKLFRIVDLSIESSGFYIPEECEYSPINPCDYFDSLDFPTDIFAPPLRPNPRSGIRSEIDKGEENSC